MAASPVNEPSVTETLNPSTQYLQSPMDCDDSSHTPQQVASTQDTENEVSNPQPDEPTILSEKRKREDPEADSTDQNPDTSRHPLWKTSLCSYFRRNSGSCSHGSSCRFAHGEDELRPRPDNTWDPTSERAKKMMKSSSELREEEEEVMMTEAVGDDDGDDDNDGVDIGLSKCLVHLPRKWNSENLRNFLGEQGVIFKSAKKKKGMSVGFVSFESEELLKSAVEGLEGKSIGKEKIKVADVIPRSIEKKSSVDGSVTKGRSAREAVTPLADMPYNDQLEHKKNSLVQILKKLTRNARKACPNGVPLPEWILKSREIGGLPCNLEGILESPQVNGYRNKCEFSVGYSLQGKPTVGFMLGNFREGVTAVEEPEDCPNVSGIACKCASILQEFLQNSALAVWNRFKNNGFWRQLTVREGRTLEKSINVENPELNISEVMLIVQVCSVGIDDAVKRSEYERLAKAFAVGAAENSPPLPLTTLVIQDHQGISNAAPTDAPLQLLSIPQEGSVEVNANNNVSEPRIHDYISSLKFSISPTAFFQVNTLAAEKLYSLAGEWAELGPDTLLFDICCGTGTIGLTLAHRVGRVIGIEMNASAVLDAQRNAEINGIKNCEFVCAKAEDVMGSLLRKYLHEAQKQDDIPDSSETSDKETLPADDVQDPEKPLSRDLGNGTTAPECLNIDGQEKTSQLPSCGSENGNNSVSQFKNVVAIVDPPRGGLHPIVTKALRTHSRLRRLVYISCNPESLVANAIELCTPVPERTEKENKNNKAWRNMGSTGLARHRVKSMPVSEPFRPVKAMAVDLFPHTEHCEMVMLLER